MLRHGLVALVCTRRPVRGPARGQVRSGVSRSLFVRRGHGRLLTAAAAVRQYCVSGYPCRVEL